MNNTRIIKEEHEKEDKKVISQPADKKDDEEFNYDEIKKDARNKELGLRRKAT